MKTIIKNIKGITLISLIVTIIVLMILAGITLKLVLGPNGLITKATYAKAQTEISGEKEQLGMAASEATLDNTGTQATLEQMKDKIVTEGITTEGNIKVGDDRLQATTPKGHTYTIDQSGNVEYIGEGAVTVPDLTEASVVFTYTPSSWTNGRVQVGISTTIRGFALQYSIDGSTWNNYSSTIAVSKNETIYARLWDGINYGGVATGNVTNIDKINPTLTISTTNTTNSITVTATGSDNESGIAGYKYSKDNGSTWTDLTTDNTYTYTGLTQGQANQIVVQVYDKAGNTVSKNAAVTTGSVTGLTSANTTFTYTPSGWTNGNVQVGISTTETGYTLQYSTDGSTWNNYTSAITITGNEAIYARLYDGTNCGGTATGNVTNIDKTNPTLTISTTNTTNSITVTATGADNESGIAGYKYSKDNGSTWTDLTTNNTYTYTGLTQGQANQIVVQVYDKAGNTVSKNVAVTTGSVTGLTSANTTFTYTPSTWTNGNVQVGITTTETGYTLQYSTDGSTWNNYTSAITITNNQAIYARLYDGTNYGGTATGNITNIDKTNPTLTISTTNTTNSITITATGADNESGIAGYKYSKDNGSTWTDLTTDNTYTYTGLTQGQANQIVVQVYDKAGNTVSQNAVVTTGSVTGLTSENTTFTYTPSGWTNGNVQVGISTTETGYTLQYSTDGSTWNNYTSAITITGNQAIYARLYDGTNYGGTATGNVTNIDKTSPTLTLSQDSNTSTRTITINATDTQSGINTIEYNNGTWQSLTAKDITNGRSATYQATASGTYTFRTIDNAGNITSQNIDVTGILVGSFVNYSAGTWTQADIDSLGSLYSGASLPTSSNPNQFGGFKAGDSKDNCITPYGTYANEYSSGWRVLDLNTDGSISHIIHAGTPEAYYNADSKKSTSILKNRHLFDMYINNRYAIQANCTEALQFDDNNDLLKTGSYYWLLVFQSDTCYIDNNANFYDSQGNCFGVRPVVSLKSGIQITGGSGTQADPYQIKGPDPTVSNSRGGAILSATDNTPIKDDEGNTVTIPAGFKISSDSATTQRDGIVIEDKDGNQYVWIPVANASNYARTDFGKYWPTNYNFTNFSETLPSDEQTSVSTYHGYYIGRYEAGDVTSTSSKTLRASGASVTNPVSIKKGQAPYNYVTRDQANTLAIGIKTAEGYTATTKLCSSYAWDTAINFIQNKVANYGTTSPQGNYHDTTFTYTDITGATQTKPSGSDILIPTGETTPVCNIYDMGGNDWEWTSEACSDSSGPYVTRGGGYNLDYSDVSAGCRSYDSTTDSGSHLGLRATLYM